MHKRTERHISEGECETFLSAKNTKTEIQILSDSPLTLDM